MKLYEVPAGAKIKIMEENTKVPPAAPLVYPDVIYKFYNLDGMYSYCTDKDGTVVHIPAWTEVSIVKDNGC